MGGSEAGSPFCYDMTAQPPALDGFLVFYRRRKHLIRLAAEARGWVLRWLRV